MSRAVHCGTAAVVGADEAVGKGVDDVAGDGVVVAADVDGLGETTTGGSGTTIRLPKRATPTSASPMKTMTASESRSRSTATRGRVRGVVAPVASPRTNRSGSTRTATWSAYLPRATLRR